MIGVFDYTVILTYGSLVSAITGIILGFNGNAFGAVICLLLCGLFDGFDGKVARSKKNRTQFEKDFGVQIDSLCDVIAFGVLPVAIGYSLGLMDYYYIPIYCFFVLCGLIRLGYFNSLELEEQRLKTNKVKGYIGLPITSSTFIFPLVFIFRQASVINYIYAITLLITGLLFISKIKIKKPGKKVFYGMVLVGIIELIFVFKGILW